MLRWLELLVMILATWRLSSLLAKEDGPWRLLERFRHFVGVRYGTDGVPWGKNWLAELVICEWCSSVWIGSALALLWFLWPAGAAWAVMPLALSAGAIAVGAWIDRDVQVGNDQARLREDTSRPFPHGEDEVGVETDRFLHR